MQVQIEKYAIYDPQRCCVLWVHHDLHVLRDLIYIELASYYETIVIPLTLSEEFEELTDKEIWRLAISLGIPTSELGSNSRKRLMQLMRGIGETKARLVETASQADWIRENAVDPLVKYRYVYDDTVPTFAAYDYLPEPMRIKTLGKGKRAFLKSGKYKVFMLLNRLYKDANYPKKDWQLRLVCRRANAQIQEEFGYKAITVTQYVSDWKQELIANEYKLTNYSKGRKRT